MLKETFVINECEHKPHIMTANFISVFIVIDGLRMDEQTPFNHIALSQVLAKPLIDFRVLHQL